MNLYFNFQLEYDQNKLISNSKLFSSVTEQSKVRRIFFYVVFLLSSRLARWGGCSPVGMQAEPICTVYILLSPRWPTATVNQSHKRSHALVGNLIKMLMCTPD